MLKPIAILTSVYLGLESSYYRGIYVGYEIGMQMDGVVYPKMENFYATHPYSPFDKLGDLYLYVTYFLILFIIGKVIQKEFLSQIISLPSILLSFLGFIQIFIFKREYLSDESKYFDLMRDTSLMDVIFVILALTLLVYQLIWAFQFYSAWKSKTKIKFS